MTYRHYLVMATFQNFYLLPLFHEVWRALQILSFFRTAFDRTYICKETLCVHPSHGSSDYFLKQTAQSKGGTGRVSHPCGPSCALWVEMLLHTSWGRACKATCAPQCASGRDCCTGPSWKTGANSTHTGKSSGLTTNTLHNHFTQGVVKGGIYNTYLLEQHYFTLFSIVKS